MNRERLTLFLCFPFLETDIREQKKYDKRNQTSMDNTVNDPHYEVKFEICVKDKINFFIKQKIFYSFLNKNIF